MRLIHRQIHEKPVENNQEFQYKRTTCGHYHVNTKFLKLSYGDVDATENSFGLETEFRLFDILQETQTKNRNPVK